MRPGLLLLILGAVLVVPSPSSACRLTAPLTDGQFRQHTVLFTATVQSVTRTPPQGDGGEVRIALSSQQAIRGVAPQTAIIDATYGDVITIVGCRSTFDGRGNEFPVGAEVVVLASRRGHSEVYVFEAARIGSAQADSLLADGPRTDFRMSAQ